MTLRERAMTVLRGGIPDAVPWFTDLTYYQHGTTQAGTLEAKYQGSEGLLQLHRDLRVGVYLFTPPLVTIERDPTLFSIEEKDIGDGKTLRVFRSPEGSLTSVTQRCEDSFSSAILEYPVKTADDLRVVVTWYQGACYSPNYDAVLA
ncbi:MAG TPA: hypothetical protein PLJ50_13110, partial [Candidatus Latescibacteria bacterium]|nr:hypothetical protein [Candidatus Latescibacterota bacterium]